MVIKVAGKVHHPGGLFPASPVTVVERDAYYPFGPQQTEAVRYGLCRHSPLRHDLPVASRQITEIKDSGSYAWGDIAPDVTVTCPDKSVAGGVIPGLLQTLAGTQESFFLNVKAEEPSFNADFTEEKERIVAVADRAVDNNITGAEEERKEPVVEDVNPADQHIFPLSRIDRWQYRL